MKQTAVEWLVEEMQKRIPTFYAHYVMNMDEVYEQAKAMEKEQIMDAVYYAMGTNFDPNMGRAELYYNTTFKSE